MNSSQIIQQIIDEDYDSIRKLRTWHDSKALPDERYLTLTDSEIIDIIQNYNGSHKQLYYWQGIIKERINQEARLQELNDATIEEYNTEYWQQQDTLLLYIREQTDKEDVSADDIIDYANNFDQSYEDMTALCYELGVIHGIKQARTHIIN